MENKIEVWKPVVGYEGRYEVSNIGRIRRLVKYINKRRVSGYKYLKGSVNSDGYCDVKLYIDGHYKTYLIHRLVASAFLDNPYNLPEVNHKDENKQNNIVSNLEWISHIDNCNHGTRNIREGIGKYKAVSKYDLDFNFICSYDSIKQAAIENNMKNSTGICESCKEKRKTAGGFIWRYVF